MNYFPSAFISHRAILNSWQQQLNSMAAMATCYTRYTRTIGKCISPIHDFVYGNECSENEFYEICLHSVRFFVLLNPSNWQVTRNTEHRFNAHNSYDASA